VSCGSTGGSIVHTCLAHDHLLDAGWTPSNCCIMARMTTIGQTDPTYEFYEGAKFGPVTWSGVELAAAAPTPAPGSTTLPLTGKEPAWSGGGTQNWPPANKKWPANLNRVVATGVSPTGETDTIDLTAPALHLSITPSSCKYLAKSGTLAYAVATAGSPEGITLDYGWFVRGQSVLPLELKVPNAISMIGDFAVGPSTTAKVQVIGPSSEGGYSTTISAALYFVDALGNVRGYADTGADAAIDVGKAHCP
jgi:hypothetical protein